MKRTNITVLDNNGETFDRYTIINRLNGDVWGASDNPYQPQGFGQYNHNIADAYWNVAFGYGWRNHCDVAKCTKFAVQNYLRDCSNVGKKITLDKLPKNVLKYIDYILED